MDIGASSGGSVGDGVGVSVGAAGKVGVTVGISTWVALAVGEGVKIGVEVAVAGSPAVGEGLIKVPNKVGVNEGVGVCGTTVSVIKAQCSAASAAWVSAASSVRIVSARLICSSAAHQAPLAAS